MTAGQVRPHEELHRRDGGHVLQVHLRLARVAVQHSGAELVPHSRALPARARAWKNGMGSLPPATDHHGATLLMQVVYGGADMSDEKLTNCGEAQVARAPCKVHSS